MYQDIHKEEVGSINKVSYKEFESICKSMIKEENVISKETHTTTKRFILKLGLEEAKKLNFKRIRINCDNNNIPSKKIIINNGGKINISNYKTKEGFSTSYIIELEEKF